MVSISPNFAPKVVSFKGEEENKAPKQNREVPKSHAGVYTGATVGALSSLCLLMQDKVVNVAKDAAKEVGGEVVAAPMLNKWVAIPLTLAVHIGMGALVDNLINKKNAEFTENTAGMAPTEATATDERAELTAKGNAFLNSNTGMKTGAIAGAIIQPLIGLARTKGKATGALNIVGGAILGALGGCGLGAIADHYANKNAEKVADKNARMNANA